MEIRPATLADISGLDEIDATIESTDFLHLERGGEGLSLSLRSEVRPLREKLIQAYRTGDELKFAYKQIAGQIDDGLALVVEHDETILASTVSILRPELGTLHLLDVRVDYDFRRQGLATAMLFQVIQTAREHELRAVFAEAQANNLPANQMLHKCGFELSGIDLRRRSNHDLVKESATLLWYATLD